MAVRLRNWQVKALVQRAFSALPGGHHANYALQRAVGGLPMSDRSLATAIDGGCRHVEALLEVGLDPTEATTFEYGAGFDLHMPLIQRALGVRRQTVVDIRRLARPTLASDIARRLERHPDPPAPWSPAEGDPNDLDAFLARNGIDYRAPADARATALADHSVDAVLTTNTNEHIPPDELTAIYRESHRILRPNGVMSLQIDYSDHWSHFDPAITAYNFLGVSDQRWRTRNSSLMFQNRLRHTDHLALIENAGFELVRVEAWGADDAGIAALATVALQPEWRDRPPEEVALTGSHVVAVRR